MEPALAPGEAVLMLHESSIPERGSLVAVRMDDKFVVKRVVALPYENVQLEELYPYGTPQSRR